MRAKGRISGRKPSRLLDAATRALQEEILLRIRAEAEIVAGKFRDSPDLGPPLGLLIGQIGARVIGNLEVSHGQRFTDVCTLFPSRSESGELYFEAALLLRHGCGEWLDRWCKAFPDQLKAFASQLYEIGHDFESVDRELEKICRLVRNVESRNYLAFVCHGEPAAPGWRAAGWLLDWPAALAEDALVSAIFNGRLDDDQTSKVCEEVQDRTEKYLVEAKKAAWNHAVISIAKPGSAPQGLQPVLPAPLKSSIQELMEKYPDLSYREICGRADDQCDREGRQVPVPSKRRKHGHRTLVDSFDCVDCRDYMQSFLSKERRHLGLHRPPKSEAPQKVKVSKLGKVTN